MSIFGAPKLFHCSEDNNYYVSFIRSVIYRRFYCTQMTSRMLTIASHRCVIISQWRGVVCPQWSPKERPPTSGGCVICPQWSPKERPATPSGGGTCDVPLVEPQGHGLTSSGGGVMCPPWNSKERPHTPSTGERPLFVPLWVLFLCTHTSYTSYNQHSGCLSVYNRSSDKGHSE